MKKGDYGRVEDMLDRAKDAADRIEGKSRLDFEQDGNLQLSLVHLVQEIGEAATQVSPEFRKKHPHVDWDEMIGMRHRLVHGYRKINYERVWSTLTIDLPLLVKQLDKLLEHSD